MGLTADDDVRAPACDCVQHRTSDPVSFRSSCCFDQDWEASYPKALASLGINSVPIQAIVATPVE